MAWRDDLHEAVVAVGRVRAVEAEVLAGAERSTLLLEVNRLLRRADLARHLATWELERSGQLLDVGYRTIAQWQRDQLGVSTHEAGKVAGLARALVHLPTVVELWATGELGAEQARLVASLRTPVTTEAFDRDEAWLAGQARDLDHHDLRRVLATWRAAADPDGTDPGGDPDAHVSVTLDGAVKIDALLDPIGGATFKDLFDEIEHELFEADWAEAKERLGREPTLDELDRTSKQRRHDVMVEIARRARTADPETASKPLVTVVTSPQALASGLAELWGGAVLSPRQLARLLEQDPVIQRFTYGNDLQPIGYSPKARLYTGKLREAILTRDRRCTGRGCEADTRRGAVDHIHPHARGGETTPSNGRGACHPCNRSRPRRRFRHDPKPHTDDPP